jgi:hypothetical protein
MATPIPKSPPRRWPLRSWVKQGLAAFAVLALWQLRGADNWHAELFLANYDCAQGEVCKLLPGLDVQTVAGGDHPYRYTTNASGFRSPELPALARDPAVFRVQVYGSSPIFGLGVDDGETFPEALREALEAALPGRRLEVMNFGLPMNYFASELTTYAAFGRAYQPDLVIFVQPELEQTLDMNARVLQIKSSPTLSALLPTPFGRFVVNHVQNLSMEVASQMSKFRAPARLKAKAGPHLDDQRSRGVRVYFFNLFDDLDELGRVLPAGLRYETQCTGMSHSAYLASSYVIPRDGHPNAGGQRYFAGILAPRLVPIITAR